MTIKTFMNTYKIQQLRHESIKVNRAFETEKNKVTEHMREFISKEENMETLRNFISSEYFEDPDNLVNKLLRYFYTTVDEDAFEPCFQEFEEECTHLGDLYEKREDLRLSIEREAKKLSDFDSSCQCYELINSGLTDFATSFNAIDLDNESNDLTEISIQLNALYFCTDEETEEPTAAIYEGYITPDQRAFFYKRKMNAEPLPLSIVYNGDVVYDYDLCTLSDLYETVTD